MTVAKTDGYTGTAKWLHWGMALIWLGNWCVGILASHWREELNPHFGLLPVAAFAGGLVYC